MREQFGQGCTECVAMRESTARNQANGSTALHLHMAMKLSSTAAVLPPLSLPKNVQLPRPMAMSRLTRPVAPLSISRLVAAVYGHAAMPPFRLFVSSIPVPPETNPPRVTQSGIPGVASTHRRVR
jgi:hypothetical protein